jgi:hypothetical protein
MMEKGEGRHLLVPIWSTLWTLHCWGGLRLYLLISCTLGLLGIEEGHCTGALGKWIVGNVRKDVWSKVSLKTPSYFADGGRL